MLSPARARCSHTTVVLVVVGMWGQDNGTWRLFAAMWLHAGLIHLASNMYGLYQAGFPAEKAHGWCKILLIYMISGIMGNVIIIPKQLLAA